MNATRVLLVEGDSSLARTTMEFLESRGLEVQLVPRGELAIADIHRIRPDVIVLDLASPGTSAADVCRELRKRYEAPIIVISTSSADEEIADGYLGKPFEARDLLALIAVQAKRRL